MTGGRAEDGRTCSAVFHHTTAMGHCSRCGGSWKARHLPNLGHQCDLRQREHFDPCGCNCQPCTDEREYKR